MRIGVGIIDDAGDSDMTAANLSSDTAPEVLSSDNMDNALGNSAARRSVGLTGNSTEDNEYEEGREEQTF
jgi:hypothetical protein